MAQMATTPFVPHFAYRPLERERVCSCHLGGGGGEALLDRDATVGLGCDGARVSSFAGLAGKGDLTCVFGAIGGFAGRRKGGLGGIGGNWEEFGDGAHGSDGHGASSSAILARAAQPYAGHT